MRGTLKYGWAYNFKTNEILSPLPGEIVDASVRVCL